MSDRSRQTAEKIFRILAEAEAAAHGSTPEEVHFHEVGAVDSIVDIIAAAVCLDDLNITEAIIPVLSEGTGRIRAAHGILPVPVPAVESIVSAQGLPLHITGEEGELVTPTGAAIAAAIRTSGTLPETFRILRSGRGAGKRSYKNPSILRAMLVEEESSGETRICKLETNVDDCSGESLGHVMDCLLREGARDVYFTPIYMKKNRPAVMLSVICMPEDAERLENIIFRETTTIGIRHMLMDRTVLSRSIREEETPYGRIRYKDVTLPDGTRRSYPEYEDLAAAAQRSGRSLQDIRLAVTREQ